MLSGYRVILYEHNNFSGRIREFSQNTAWVGDNFNDITSSIVVEPIAAGTIIYADGDYRGHSQRLMPGLYNVKDLTIGNNKLSSLKVLNGYKVTLFEATVYRSLETGRCRRVDLKKIYSPVNLDDGEDDSIRKAVYLSVKEATKKRTMPARDGELAYSQIMIFFSDRFAA